MLLLFFVLHDRKWGMIDLVQLVTKTLYLSETFDEKKKNFQLQVIVTVAFARLSI
jgi:hypothetical protein